MKKELLTTLEKYKPLFIKLTNFPLKQFEGQKKVYLHLTKDEKEDLYADIQARFIELYLEFDESRGVPFSGYIKTNLGWFAHHEAEALFELRKQTDYHYDIDDLELQYVEENVEESHDTELSFGMEAAINTLPPRQKTVVEMHYVEGLPVSVIAESLGITEEACYSHRKFGLQKIRKYLKENPLD